MLDRLRASTWLLPTALTALAAVVLFVRLGEPARIIFDETYYVGDARNYLDIGVEDSFAVHPTLGKWLIAAGIALFGDDPFGWRAAGAAAGTLTILLTYLVGTRLLRDRALAALAAVLLLTDGLFFVQARTAMLDIFLAMFVALAAWALLVDRDRRGLGAPVHPPERDATVFAADRSPATDPPAAPDSQGEPTYPLQAGGSVDTVPADETEHVPDPSATHEDDGGRSRVWRWLAGVALGLAVATKWSGLLAVGAAGLVVLGWELAHRHRQGRLLARPFRLVGSLLGTLVVVPAAVYAVSWVPWLVNYEQASPSEACAADASKDVSVADRIGGLVCFHDAIWDFHSGLEAEHPYRAPAYSWPVLARPVVYYWETCSGDRAAGVATTNDDGELVEPEPCVVEQGQAGEVLAVGNPALWWLFLAAAIPLLSGVAQRDPRAGFIAAFWGAQFVPWLLPPMGTRPVFFFYMSPVVAFLALGVAYACVSIAERRDLVTPTLVALSLGAVTLGASFVIFDSDAVRWSAAGVAYVVGALVGGVVARRRGDRPQRPAAGWNVGHTVAVIVAALAIAAFTYFYPIWSGLPLDEDAVRARWWIRPGWI